MDGEFVINSMFASRLGSADSLGAEELVAAVMAESGGRDVCLTSSFQTEDMVVLHLLRRHLPDVPVIFLETGYHFPALVEYRDKMVRDWGLNLISATPKLSLAEHEGRYGRLHIVQPTECCSMRKVEPLMRSLEPFCWWFTGLRREQSPTRAKLKKVEDHKLPTGIGSTWNRMQSTIESRACRCMTSATHRSAASPAHGFLRPAPMRDRGDGAAISWSAASTPSARRLSAAAAVRMHPTS
jgi:3'-phosphoadenosine 5'-phosphosulfate sulfotransferase (PAPS reductase)/FAD synthetase